MRRLEKGRAGATSTSLSRSHNGAQGLMGMPREKKKEYLAQQEVNAGLSGGVVPHSLQFFLCLLVANKRKGRQRGDRVEEISVRIGMYMWNNRKADKNVCV